MKAGRGLRPLCALAGVPRWHWGHGAGNILGAHWRDELCWLLWDRPRTAFFLVCKKNCYPCMHTPVPLCTAMLTFTSSPCAAPHVQPGMPGPTSYQHSALISCFLWGDFSLTPLLQPKVLRFRWKSTADLGLANSGQPA